MLKVRIADNPYTQQRGLMFVESMKDDEGMLFAFNRPQNLSFWGLSTYIPLDIAFIDSSYRIVKIGHIDPHQMWSVGSESLCVAAIEANAGYFERQGIKVGDSIKVQYSSERTADLTAFYTGDEKFADAIVHFEISEGLTEKTAKDKNTCPSKKVGQVVPPSGQPVKVEPKDQQPVGDPVMENVNGQNLPVVSVSDLDSILEDSFDEPEEAQQLGQDGQPQDQLDQEPTPEPEPEPQEPEKEYPVFNNAFEATEWAEKNGEVVRMSYVTKRGRQITRDVEPHGKFHSQSTHRTILVTFDETVGNIRAFILSNISSWAFIGKQFQKKFAVRA